MKTLARLSTCAIALVLGGSVSATRPGEYALLKYQSVVFTCAAQGGSYSFPIWERFLGIGGQTSEADREEVRRDFEKGFVKSEWAMCVRRMKWVSDGLCEAIATALAGPDRDIGPALFAHRTELASLKHVNDYFEGARRPQPDRAPCPGT
jgi:hypothetical protein